MDCMQIEQLISPFMDDALTPGEAGSLKSHLAVCKACQQEYEDLVKLSATIKQMGDVLIPAPTGFKDALMQRIQEEITPVPVVETRWFKRSWRQVVAGTAAALLLFFGAISMSPGPILQIADKAPIVNTTSSSGLSSKDQPGVNSLAEVNKPVDNLKTSQTGVEAPPTVKENNNAPIVSSPPVVNNVNSSPVFLNKERSIKTTLLKVKVNESAAALANASQIAGDLNAQFQNLGQQVNENGSYTTVKITIAKSSANILISKLSNLGTVSGKEVDNKDITARYSETLSQYQSLVTQRATSEDSSQRAQLDQRIKTLQNELNDWEQQAEQETIVLWLEK